MPALKYAYMCMRISMHTSVIVDADLCVQLCVFPYYYNIMNKYLMDL